MIIYLRENYQNLFTVEYMDMYRRHWKEIGRFDKNKVKLSPDWDMYRALGKLNKLALYSAKHNNILIGYALFIVSNHPHYKEVMIAENDLIYLVPEHRKGLTGYNFVKFCTDNLKNIVDIVSMNIKTDKSFGVIMKRLGFNLMEHVYVWEI